MHSLTLPSSVYGRVAPELGAVILTEKRALHGPFGFSLKLVVLRVST